MKSTYPRAQPMIIPGRKRPAGTKVPYVVIVKKYQIIKKNTMCQYSMTTLLSIMFLMMSPSVDKKRLRFGSN